MIILFINYIDSNKLISGSSVRPAKILQAFKESGHDIIMLTGEQTDKNRISNIKEFEIKIREIRPDICYIESPTYPIIRHQDRKLISRIHKMNIPIGYFYRDFYRKFPEQFPHRKDFNGIIKELGLGFLQFLTDRVLNSCDIVYFPSIEATSFFNYNCMRALPPAGENHIEYGKKLNHVGIYVGGVSVPYDINLLMDTFHELYKQDTSYKLILVCRKDEWEMINHPYKDAKWLEVHHASGSDLVPYYREASFAFVIPDAKFAYNQFAVSVKTFEYISYGIPVIAVNCTALKKIVENEKIGIAVEANVNSFVNAVQYISCNQETYDTWIENVKESLIKRNLWKHRVDSIINDLTIIKQKKGL